MLWTVLNFSSCAYHQVADFVYCHGQQRQDWQLFSAARMLQQAGTLVLLCTGCSSAWPLPFTLSALWHNLYRSMDWAVKTMEMAQTGPPSPGSAGLFVRALSSCQIWETEEPQTLSMDPERKPWLPDEAEGWKTCPLRLGPVQLVKGKLQVDVRRFLRQPLLQVPGTPKPRWHASRFATSRFVVSHLGCLQNVAGRRPAVGAPSPGWAGEGDTTPGGP